MDDYQRALDKAKIRLMNKDDSAFFSTLCFSLKTRWDTSIPTACTNGTEIRYNPEFFMSLTTDEQVFLLLHEAMHVAYLHMERLQDRNHRKWNIATDHVINLQLIERGFTMPKDGLADPRYKGMSAEEVYKLLDDQQAKDTPVMLDLEPSPEGMDPAQVQRDVEDILIRAAIQSKMAGDQPGTIPADIQIFLEKLLNPKLPWYQILRKFFNSMTKNDYSWKKPNRRYFPQYYLPGMWSEKLMNLAIAIDSSGSVSDEDFTQFVTEIHAILKQFNPDKISLLQFDSGLRSVDEVRSTMELMKVKFTGRGGTRIEPVLEWATEHKPQALLIFSDGFFRIWTDQPDPGMPVVWLIHDNDQFQAPFGKVIQYEMETTP